nr:hypothetical protein [Methylomarinum sp. Ch1-1]MDP4523207.1 hypothetical protein [Methylomarinum sp. Ch1-1]
MQIHKRVNTFAIWASALSLAVTSAYALAQSEDGDILDDILGSPAKTVPYSEPQKLSTASEVTLQNNQAVMNLPAQQKPAENPTKLTAIGDGISASIASNNVTLATGADNQKISVSTDNIGLAVDAGHAKTSVPSNNVALVDAAVNSNTLDTSDNLKITSGTGKASTSIANEKTTINVAHDENPYVDPTKTGLASENTKTETESQSIAQKTDEKTAGIKDNQSLIPGIPVNQLEEIARFDMLENVELRRVKFLENKVARLKLQQEIRQIEADLSKPLPKDSLDSEKEKI